MRGKPIDNVANILNQGHSKIVIGDIPISFDEVDAPAIESINANIKDFRCPGFTLKLAREYYYKATTHVPITEDNEYYDEPLTVEMFMDSRMENYWTLYRYMETLQSGKTGGWVSNDDTDSVYDNKGHYKNRLAYIPKIDIIMGDAVHQRYQTMRFSRCYLTKLDSIPMIQPGSSPKPITFIASFVFSKREIFRTDPYKPSETQVPPLAIND